MPAWVLALVSSCHLTLTVLGHHRCAAGRRRWALVGVSAAMSGLPWVLPSLAALAAGLVAHGLWLAAGDALGRGSARPPAARPAGRDGAVAGAPAAAAPGTFSATPRPAGPPRPVRTAHPADALVRGSAGLADAAAAVPASRGSGFVPLTVLATIDETPDIRTFRLWRPGDFAFQAGQFLPVRVRVDGRDHVRCYSISSAPEIPGYLEISVKRQGRVSSYLHSVARPGSTVFVRRPAGTFVYPSDDDRPLVLVAGGVGITPLVSMVRHALAADPQRPVTLFQSARLLAGLAFADELRVLARRHPRFRWVPAVSGEASTPPHVYPGRIDRGLLSTAAADLPHSLVYLCGPEAMIASLRGVLASLGVPADQVRFERFEAAVAAMGATEHERRRGGGLAPPGTSAAAADAGGGADAIAAGPGRRDAAGAEVHFSRSSVRQRVRPGTSILDAAESCGVDIPSLCRAGVCGTCRTRAEGDLEPDVPLPADEAAGGFVLACATRIRGTCTVEA
jgi:ferredoxin-NADP reductase